MSISRHAIRYVLAVVLAVSATALPAGWLGKVTAGTSAPAIIATIDLPGVSPCGVAVNPVTNSVYVTNEYGTTVSVIDGATSMLLETITVGVRPFYPAVNSVTNKIYVPNYQDNTVSVIDGASNTVSPKTPIGVGTMPSYVAVNEITNRIYVTNYFDGTVSVIDGTTDAVIDTVTVGYGVAGISVNPSNNRIFVVNLQGVLSVIDGATDIVVPLGSVGWAPCGVAVNPTTNRVYVGNSDGSLSVIDAETGCPATPNTIPIGEGAVQQAVYVEVDVVTNLIYASANSNGVVAVIDGASNSVVATIATGSNPAGVGVNSRTHRIYVANTTSQTVSVIGVAPDNQGPVTSNALSAPNPAKVGAGVVLTAAISDLGTGGSNIASAEYQLGTGSWLPMAIAGGGVTVTATANIGPFSSADVVSISVRGTDGAGNVGAPDSLLLAVYDPTGGFVTGGGWINSPAGAYKANPALTGKATFGFVSKYKKGADIPSGNTEFQFHEGSLNFSSTSYEWLVVTGSHYARFKGSGTINGQGDYKFMLWAGDGTGPGGADTFRIKIDGNSGTVYDNGMDQAISGGSIVVHDK